MDKNSDSIYTDKTNPLSKWFQNILKPNDFADPTKNDKIIYGQPNYNDIEKSVGIDIIKEDRRKNNPDLWLKKKPTDVMSNGLNYTKNDANMNWYAQDNNKIIKDATNQDKESTANPFYQFMSDFLIYTKIPGEEEFNAIGGLKKKDSKIDSDEVKYKAKLRLQEAKKLGMINYEEGREDDILKNVFDLYNMEVSPINQSTERAKKEGAKKAFEAQQLYYQQHPELYKKLDFDTPNMIESSTRFLNSLINVFKPEPKFNTEKNNNLINKQTKSGKTYKGRK